MTKIKPAKPFRLVNSNYRKNYDAKFSTGKNKDLAPLRDPATMFGDGSEYNSISGAHSPPISIVSSDYNEAHRHGRFSMHDLLPQKMM